MRDTLKEHTLSRARQAYVDALHWTRTSPWALIALEIGIILGLWLAAMVVFCK